MGKIVDKTVDKTVDKGEYYQAIKRYYEGELDKSETGFLKLEKSYESYPNIYRWLGKIYMEKLDFENAKNNFKKALEKCYDSVQKEYSGQMFIGFPLSENENKDVDKDALAWTYHDLGYICIDHEDCVLEAKTNLVKAIELMNESNKFIPWFINDLGFYYYSRKRNQEAIEQYNIIIKKYENNVPKEKDGYAELFCGLAEYQSGDVDNARNHLNESLEIFREKIKDLDSQVPKPVDESTISVRTDRRSYELIIADIQTDIARIDIDEMQYEKAEFSLLQAVEKYKELKPFIETHTPLKKSKAYENFSAIYINLGIAYFNQGLNDKSRKQFVKALGYSQSARAYYNLGNIFAKEKNPDRAESLYRSALEINPELKEARNALNNLKKGEEKKIDWWDWWFDRENSAKPVFGLLLMVALLVFSLSLALPYTEETTIIKTAINNSMPLQNETRITSNGSTTVTWINKTSFASINIDPTRYENYTNQTSKMYPSIATTVGTTYPQKLVTTKSIGLSQEYKLIMIALIILLLMHPQIKGFSAGSVKFDIEPISVSKGASPPK